MKKMMMALMTLVATSALAAPGPDQEYVVVDCESTQKYADKGLDLQVIQGGFAGLTRIATSEMWIGGVRKNNFIVSERQLPPDQKNNFVIYSSNVVTLVIDLTKVDADGKNEAAFIKKAKNGKKQTEALKCEFVK